MALIAPIPLFQTYVGELTWYWAINWDHGFVRRGLCGELLQLLTSGSLASGAQAMTGVSACLGGLVLLATGLLLLGRGDPSSVGVGLALVVSPVGMLMAWSDPRPELFGLLALPGITVAMGRSPRVGKALLLGISLWLGVVTLMTEDVLFAVVPWGVILIAALTSGQPTQQRLREIAILVLVPATAATAVVVFGRADPAQVAALQRHASALSETAVPRMLFVGQGLGDNVRVVLSSGIGYRALTMGVTALVLVVVGLALSLSGVHHEVRRLPDDRLFRLSLLLPLLALLVETATGIDWPRWLGQLGSGALLTLALIMLDRPPAATLPWTPRRLMAVAAGTTVLFLIPTVPYLLPRGELISYWLGRLP